MALIPTFEHLLVEVRQGIGIKALPSEDRFVAQAVLLRTHAQMMEKLISAIFKSLNMDEQACKDAMGNLLEWANFHQALELHTWTGNASKQQVLWHLLAYSFVPGAAHRLAFWNLAGIQRGLPMDAGMPGGEFWFLPNWDVENNKIDLPLHQVIDWLLDLLDAPISQELGKKIGRKFLHGDEGDLSAVKNLQNWRKGTTPKSAEKIDQLFEVNLIFSGSFQPDENLAFEAKFQEALALALRKGLNAETLHHQIPITVVRLQAIFDGSAPDEEKQDFIRLIALRYAQPSMATIRQRFRIARLAQDGYERLVKELCGGDVEPGCTDLTKNKLLQLLVLFQNIYNLTIAAWKAGGSYQEQDAWFEARLAPWDKADLLLSIVPSYKEEAYLGVAERLTRKFMAMEPNSPLQDLVPLGEGDAGAVIKSRVLSLKHDFDEDSRFKELYDRTRRSSPWRALQAETSYWVVSQFVQAADLTSDVRAMAIKRLYELAAKPGQTTGTNMLEIGFLLNGDSKKRPKDIQQRVEQLLAEAQASQGYEEWKAPLLRLQAKHRLMQNDFEGTCVDFKAALTACSERGFGAVRGEIARDAWATEIAVQGFVPNNQEAYYRDMLRYDMFEAGLPTFEDAAVVNENFFWTILYQPYPGFERPKRQTEELLEAAMGETFSLIETADWDGLQLWMKRHAKQLRKGNFKDTRCDTVLTLWLKFVNGLESTLPNMKTMLPADMSKEFEKIEKHLQNRRYAIRLLLQAWPEQARIADFKGQTPLMRVADKGDVELTRLLAPLSHLDAQDFRGRTALHSAASSRSPECVAIILDRDPDVSKVTLGEGNTALHTAVRFGQSECVRLILAEFPGLALVVNAAGQTPLDMALDLLENLPRWQTYMRNENRRTGSKNDFERIVDIFLDDSLGASSPFGNLKSPVGPRQSPSESDF